MIAKLKSNRRGRAASSKVRQLDLYRNYKNNWMAATIHTINYAFKLCRMKERTTPCRVTKKFGDLRSPWQKLRPSLLER